MTYTYISRTRHLHHLETCKCLYGLCMFMHGIYIRYMHSRKSRKSRSTNTDRHWDVECHDGLCVMICHDLPRANSDIGHTHTYIFLVIQTIQEEHDMVKCGFEIPCNYTDAGSDSLYMPLLFIILYTILPYFLV